MATDEQLKAFVARHHQLLDKEREAEIERTSLLLSNCPPKLLEQKGLCLASLSITSVGIGLGGKTCVYLSLSRIEVYVLRREMGPIYLA